MSDYGFNLQVASGARRLTVHCRFCGATLLCPMEEPDLWAWLKKDEAQEFYRFHREHAGIFADKMVGAEIEVEGKLLPNQEDDLPTFMNLLDAEGMSQIKRQ